MLGFILGDQELMPSQIGGPSLPQTAAELQATIAMDRELFSPFVRVAQEEDGSLVAETAEEVAAEEGQEQIGRGGGRRLHRMESAD